LIKTEPNRKLLPLIISVLEESNINEKDANTVAIYRGEWWPCLFTFIV